VELGHARDNIYDPVLITTAVNSVFKHDRELRKATMSFDMSVFRPSVRPSAWSSAPTGPIFTKFDNSVFFKKKICRENSSFTEMWQRVTGTLHEDRYTILIMSSSVIFRTRNFSDWSCRENPNTHFVFNNFFFFRKSYGLWDNVEKYCTAGQATVNIMGACALHAGYLGYTHTHTHYM